MTFSFDDLSRLPDVESRDLRAWDAADSLILDESADARAALPHATLAVIGDTHGALVLGAASAGALGIRSHQDSLVGQKAAHRNASQLGLAASFVSHGLERVLLENARVVLVRLPRSLDALRDIAGMIAAHAAPDVEVYFGGRIKYMTTAMNDVIREFFSRLDITHARQKSRVLVAREPHDGTAPILAHATHEGLLVCARGGVFAGPSLDVGTRFLLENLPHDDSSTLDDPFIDMACGTGIVGASWALRHPDAFVYASDDSAAAVVSATATAHANNLSHRVTVVRDDRLSTLDDASRSRIALNPPFHVGGAVEESLAPRFFEDAARVLRPGGELWTVWNTHLAYRAALTSIVGRTRQVARNAKFTVTVSVRH